MTQFYNGARDMAMNSSLYFEWLDTRYADQIISWVGIIGLGYFAFYMARYMAKHF